MTTAPRNTFTAYGMTTTLVVQPKGDKFVVAALDENGFHRRYMFGKKFDTAAAAHAAIADYCA